MNNHNSVIYVVIILSALVLGAGVYNFNTINDREYNRLHHDLFAKAIELKQCYDDTIVDSDPVEDWFYKLPEDAVVTDKIQLVKEQLDKIEFDLHLCKSIKGIVDGRYTPESD